MAVGAGSIDGTATRGAASSASDDSTAALVQEKLQELVPSPLEALAIVSAVWPHADSSVKSKLKKEVRHLDPHPNSIVEQ